MRDPARAMAETLRQASDDYFVYARKLPVLPPKPGVTRLILTRMAADICVLFTAAHADMRDYSLWVLGQRWALDLMHQRMSAINRPTNDTSPNDWLAANA